MDHTKPTLDEAIAAGRVVIDDQTHFDAVRKFARSVGAEDELEGALTRFAHLPEARMKIYKDWAPQSFAFLLESKGADGIYRRDFNGGILWSGPASEAGPGNVLDGGFPSLSVHIGPTGDKHRWSMHT
jgi:hypothetical protein